MFSQLITKYVVMVH